MIVHHARTALRRSALAGVMLSTLMVGQAPAQSPQDPQRDDRPPRLIERDIPEPEPFEKLQLVRAEGIHQMAFSAPRNALILRRAARIEHDLTVLPLDGNGNLRNDARTHVNLPVPEALRKYRVHTTAIATHPEFPVVYVWRDIDERDEEDLPEELIREKFNHLLVYEITDNHTLKLRQQTGRGRIYAYDQGGGTLLVDPSHHRLFVPNTYGELDSGTLRYQLAYTAIDERGHVDVSDGALQLTGQIANRFVYSHRSWPFGYLVVREDRVIAGAEGGPMTWDMGRAVDPLFRYHLDGAGHRIAMSMHPQLPLVYTTGSGTSHVYRARHVNGYLTLLPQRITLRANEELNLYGRPVLMENAQHLAVSDREGRIYLLSLDDQGWLTGDVKQAAVSGDSWYARAMVYVQRHDRLYASVHEPMKQANENDE